MNTGIVAAHVKIRASLELIRLSEAVYAIVNSELYWLKFLNIAIVSGSCRKLNVNKGGAFALLGGHHGSFEMIQCEMKSYKTFCMSLIYERLKDTRGSFRVNLASRDDMMLPGT